MIWRKYIERVWVTGIRAKRLEFRFGIFNIKTVQTPVDHILMYVCIYTDNRQACELHFTIPQRQRTDALILGIHKPSAERASLDHAGLFPYH